MEPTKDNPVVIVRLKSSNVQCLKADGIDIIPNSNVITLIGANAAGKTSVLNSIWWVLTGKKAIPDRPIREGAASANVEVDMGEFIARLKISAAGGAKVTVESKGVPLRSPQEFLQSHSNEILLDLMKFMRLGETAEGKRKQLETLRRLVGLDFSALEASYRELYARRTLVNRELETTKGKLTNFPYNSDVPNAEVSVSDLMAQLKQANDHNRGITEKEFQVGVQAQKVNHSIGELEAINTEIAQLEAQLRGKRDLHNEVETSLLNAQTQLSAMQLDLNTYVKMDTKPIENGISAADETNTKIRGNNRRKELSDEIAAKDKESAQLTAELEKIEADKQSQLTAAKFPIPELSFDETGILLNGLPLSQGSMAQQLKAIAAIGFAFNPKIRVALIRDASILDGDSIKAIAAMAEANHGQVWMEKVATLDEHGKAKPEPFTILIEDGALKE